MASHRHRWTCTGNMFKCTYKEGCDCDHCFPLFDYSSPSASHTTSEDEIDDVARIYGFPSLPTQRELRERRRRDGVGLTPREVRELMDHRRFQRLVNNFEVQMANAREVARDGVFYQVFVTLLRGIQVLWRLVVAFCTRTRSMVAPECIIGGQPRIESKSDGNFSTDTEAAAYHPPRRRRRRHVVINVTDKNR